MSSRVVMVNDLLAFIDGAKQWLENQLADGAGTKTTTFGTSAGAADGSDRASVAATPTPPSAGTTASGAGSVAAAVEALRGIRNKSMIGMSVVPVMDAIDALLALDVPGKIAKAESDAAKLREDLNATKDSVALVTKQRDDNQSRWEETVEQLTAAQASAKTWEENFREMTLNCNLAHESLRVEREACDTYRKWHVWYQAPCKFVGNAVDHRCDLCKAHDARRAAEKNNQAGDPAESEGLCAHASSTISNTSAPGASPDESVNCATPSIQKMPKTDPVQVTDEDRRVAEEWNAIHGMGYWNVRDVARLIAKVRQERDGAVRELVETLRELVSPPDHHPLIYVTPEMIRNAAALVKKHGGAA